MRAEQTAFEACWWGSGLEKAGLPTLRPRISTYGRYNYEALPPAPFEARNLAWLDHVAGHESHVGQERADQLADLTASLRSAAASIRLELPEAFLRFVEAPELQSRIRSNTDCFLDLGQAPVPCPVASGHLVRFMADSQGVLYWYLFFPSTGPDHAVLASRTLYGTPEELWEDEEREDAPLEFVAESFEEFLWRFWVENELWFAVYYDKTTIPESARAYVAQYRARGEELA